jgi:hypothetical protein
MGITVKDSVAPREGVIVSDGRVVPFETVPETYGKVCEEEELMEAEIVGMTVGDTVMDWGPVIVSVLVEVRVSVVVESVDVLVVDWYSGRIDKL